MSKENTRWKTRQLITPQHHELARLTSCHPIIAALLSARGYETAEQIRSFFKGTLSELPPYNLMSDMMVARDRLVRAIRGGELITIYGDYDVDGITATSTLLIGLRRLGARVDYHIPHRTEEGYGLNRMALTEIAERGASVVVTVDCGISAREEAMHARAIGLDLIITDHHQPPSDRVDALAVVNPKQTTCSYPFKELAGVGVAYQLLLAVSEKLSPEIPVDDLLELVAMGTIADVVPLVGPNRIMVKEGLKGLSNTRSIGLKALLTAAGFEGKPISAGNVAFGLAPRINACGRIGHAELAVELLLTDDYLRAKQLAEELDDLNNRRQALEQRTLEEAHAMIDAEIQWKDRRAIILGGEGWHPGVIGIVASRLVEELNRPVLLFAFDGDTAKGSGRSIKGFHLYHALASHSEYLTKYGGHELAAGMSLERRRFDEFCTAFINYAQQTLTDEDLLPVISADLEIDPTQIDLALVEQLVRMEPFGMGNPSPVFMLRGMNAAYTRELSQGRHFKARVKSGSSTLDAVAWRKGDQIAAFTGNLDLVGSLERNDYNGQSTVQLILRHWRTSEPTRTTQASELAQTVAEKGKVWVYCRSENEFSLLREQFDCDYLDGEIAASSSAETPSLPAGVFIHLHGRRLETTVHDLPNSDVENILLLDLPYQPLGTTNVRVLVGKEEIRRTREKLLWLLPDRDHLATVFRWLRKVEPANLDTLAAMLVDNGLERSESKCAAQTITRVLVELGLLEIVQGCLSLISSSSVDLNDSATFRQSQEQRHEILSWYDQIMAR